MLITDTHTHYTQKKILNLKNRHDFGIRWTLKSVILAKTQF